MLRQFIVDNAVVIVGLCLILAINVNFSRDVWFSEESATPVAISVCQSCLALLALVTIIARVVVAL